MQTLSFAKIEPTVMAVPKVNKHELRTKQTREALLRAAETIFVRDGYEGAELGEIAALAGRTKGAIYAQFKSKEDIFFALVDEQRTRRRARVQKLLAESRTTEENLAALRRFYQEFAEDKAWALIVLEYKLFTIRHPKSQQRFQSVMAESLSKRDEERIAAILGPAGKGKNSVSRVVAIQTLQLMLSALALEAKFDPDLEEGDVQKVLRRVFDALLEVPSR